MKIFTSRFIYGFILIILSDGILANPNSCNPLNCFNVLNSFFEDDPSALAFCIKLRTILDCTKKCLYANENNLLLKGLKNIENNMCHTFGSLANKCANHNKFELLYCIYKSLKTSPKNSADNELMMCRRVMEAKDCANILNSCTEHQRYMTSNVLDSLFEPMRKTFCPTYDYEYETLPIWDLEIEYPLFSQKFENLARCFDKNRDSVNSCGNSKLQSTNAMKIFQDKGCREFYAFLVCIQKMIEVNCKEYMHSYNEILSNILKSINSSCIELAQKSLLSISSSATIKSSEINTNNVLEETFDTGYKGIENKAQNLSTNDSGSNSTTQNSTEEMVVVHQHIVISVVKHTNAASYSELNLLTYALILSAILFFN